MPVYEITSPDGKIYEVTAPEGASEEDIMSYAQGQFKQPENGFLKEVGEKAQERAIQAADIQQAYRSGEISKPEEVFQLTGKVGAGLVGDVAGELVEEGVEAAKYLDELTGGYGSAGISGMVRGIGSLPAMGGGTIGERIPEELQRLGGAYEEFREEHPRAATNIEAAANLALLGVPAVKRGEDVIDASGKVIKSLGKTDISKLTSENVRKVAGDLFQKADEIGGTVKNEFWDDYIKDLRQIRKPTEMRQALKGDDPVVKAIDALSRVESPKSLRAIKDADEILGEMAEESVDNFGKYTKDGRKYLQMQMSLRDKLNNAPESMFEGGKEGFETIKEARKYWAASLRIRDIESVLQKAQDTAQPATTIKNGFRRIRDNPKKFNRYTPEEQFAIKKAASTGTLEGFLRLSGSGLVPIAAGVAGGATTGGLGGLVAAGTAFAGQQGARAAGTRMARKKGEEVIRDIARGVTGYEKQKFIPTMGEALSTAGAVARPSGVVSFSKENLGLSGKAQDIYARKRELRNKK